MAEGEARAPGTRGVDFSGLYDDIGTADAKQESTKVTDVTILRELYEEQQEEIRTLREFTKELHQMYEQLQAEVRQLRASRKEAPALREPSPARPKASPKEETKAATCTYILRAGADAGQRCPNKPTSGERCSRHPHTRS